MKLEEGSIRCHFTSNYIFYLDFFIIQGKSNFYFVEKLIPYSEKIVKKTSPLIVVLVNFFITIDRIDLSLSDRNYNKNYSKASGSNVILMNNILFEVARSNFLDLISVVIQQVGKIRKTAARRREYHILFMVLTTAACYLLCWMPYGIVAMMATFGPPNIISPVASVVPSLLAKSSTVINPLIYILMNKQVSAGIFLLHVI